MLKKILLITALLIPLFVSAQAWHYQTVTRTSNDAVTTTPVKVQGSELENHGFAIWEDTMTMDLTVWFGNTYTANVMSITVPTDKSFEMNCYDADVLGTGLYVATTSTAKVNYISRIKKGF
jgi:hypothetical protein